MTVISKSSADIAIKDSKAEPLWNSCCELDCMDRDTHRDHRARTGSVVGDGWQANEV